MKAALLRQQPDATLADEVKHLRAETKRKTDIIHGLTAEKNMYTSEMATMRVTQEVSIIRHSTQLIVIKTQNVKFRI